MLTIAYSLAEIGFDTAENEPAKNLQTFANFANSAPLSGRAVTRARCFETRIGVEVKFTSWGRTKEDDWKRLSHLRVGCAPGLERKNASWSCCVRAAAKKSGARHRRSHKLQADLGDDQVLRNGAVIRCYETCLSQIQTKAACVDTLRLLTV